MVQPEPLIVQTKIHRSRVNRCYTAGRDAFEPCHQYTRCASSPAMKISGMKFMITFNTPSTESNDTFHAIPRQSQTPRER